MTSPILQFTRKESLCNIQFTSKEKKFKRTCILPMNMNHEAIKEYFAASVCVSENFVEILSTEEVYVLNSQIEEAKSSVSGYIDAYWLDVITYLASIEQDEKVENFTIVAGMYTKEKDIENIVSACYTNSKILVHDIRDGWLMRPEKLKR